MLKIEILKSQRIECFENNKTKGPKQDNQKQLRNFYIKLYHSKKAKKGIVSIKIQNCIT